MKAETYLQIVPEFTQSGKVKRIKVARATQTRPPSPEPNALVLKATFDVDEAIFATPEVELVLDADGESLQHALVPVVVGGRQGEA